MSEHSTALDAATSMLGESDPRPLAMVLRVLGHEQRIRIVRSLHTDGPQPLRVLRGVITGGDAWEHVRVLRDAGIVTMHGQGKAATWGLTPGALARAAALIKDGDGSPHP